MKSDGAKTPPLPPNPSVSDVATGLSTESAIARPASTSTVEDVLDDVVADAEYLRRKKTDRADEPEPNGPFEFGRDLPRFGCVFENVEDAHEGPRPDCAEHAEQRVEQQLARGDECKRAGVEGRMISEKRAGDDGRDDARNDDRRERARREVT